MLPPLTFIVNFTMNLLSKPYHEYERKENHSPCFENTYESPFMLQPYRDVTHLYRAMKNNSSSLS